MTQKIAIKNNYNLAVPSEMAGMASVLREHIVKHKLYVEVKGKNYILVEGWQFAGGLLGLFPRIKEIKEISDNGKSKWQAMAEIVDVKTGNVIGSGFAVCSADEAKGGKKIRTDEYAVASMAQTRAIGKAYRNLIGWVMKMSGYETTPAEEMPVNNSANKDEDLKMNIKPTLEKLKKAKNEVELRKIWQELSQKERNNPDINDYKDNLKSQFKCKS